MPQKMIAKQMLDANKAAFDTAFQAMVTLQDQAERMMASFMEQGTWLPDEGKKVIHEWLGACKKGREDYKKNVDDGYKRLLEFLKFGG